MRIAKVLVLVAVAMTALASVGASAAMATETTLCKVGTEAPFCKAENRYPAGTSLKGSAAGETQLITSFGTMKCKSSSVEGSTTAAQGAPLQVGSLQWSLSTCNLGGTPCTASAAGTTGNLAWTGEGEGTFEGKGKWQVACGEAMSCSFAMPRISAVSGSTGHLIATEVSVETQGGLACPKSAKLTTNYTVSSPTALFLEAATEGVPPASTTMCKKLEGYCSAGNRYPSGTTIKGTASDFTLPGTGGGFGALNCKEATLAGKTTAESGQPLGVEMTSLVFIECRLGTSAIKCSVSSTIMSSNGITQSVGFADGIWDIAGTRVFMPCGEVLKCEYRVASVSGTVTVEHGTPGTIRAEAPMERVGTELCPSKTTFHGNFTLSSPSGSLFFTNAMP